MTTGRPSFLWRRIALRMPRSRASPTTRRCSVRMRSTSLCASAFIRFPAADGCPDLFIVDLERRGFQGRHRATRRPFLTRDSPACVTVSRTGCPMEHAASLVLVGGLMVTALQTSRATSQSPVFKADVPSVEVDARVTDKHHQFVRDLQRADFVLLDDGRPQTITTFALVDIPREQWSPAAHNGAAASEGAEGVAHPGGGRTYVILIDTVHIDAARARATSAAATLFVERYLFSNDQASIVCIGASTPAEITSDREKLKRDVARCTDRGNPLLGVGTTDNHEQAVHAAVMTMRGVATIATALGRISERRKAIVLFSQGIDLDYANVKKFPDAL